MDYNIIIDVYAIAAIAAISIGIFFIIYFMSSKLITQSMHRILVYILAVSILFVGYNYLVHSRLIYEFPWIFMFGRHLDLLIYVLLFFYFGAFRTDRVMSLKKVHISLLITFLFILLIKSPWYHFSSVSYQHHILDRFYSDTRPGPVSIWKSRMFFWLKFALPLVFLSLAGYRMFHYALPKLKSAFIKNLLILSFVTLVLFVLLSNWLFEALYKLTAISFIEWPIELLVLSFVQIVLIFYAIKVNESHFSFSKYKRSPLSSNDMLHYFEQLKYLMENDKAYLNPELTLNKVADALHINTSYLSQTINSELDSGFSDFLNSYRIEEAKKLLKDSENDKFTIDAIAQKAGFRSTSPFYKAFRRHTGMSPNEFKRSDT